MNKLRSNSGSALVMIMTTIGILSIVLTAGLTIASHLQNQTQDLQSKLATTKVANYLAATMADPAICAGAIAPLTGLGFFPAGFNGDPASATAANNQFDPALLTDPARRQMIQIETDLPEISLRKNTNLSKYHLTVDQFYIRNARQKPGSSIVEADTYIQLSDGGLHFQEQKVGTLYMTIGGTTMSKCQMQIDAETICENMNCNWSDTRTPKCLCQTPTLDCRTDPSAPNAYVYGYNPSSGQPICKTADFTCASGYFNGFGSDGRLICKPAVSAGIPLPPPPPATPSPANPTPPGGCDRTQCVNGPIIIATVKNSGTVGTSNYGSPNCYGTAHDTMSCHLDLGCLRFSQVYFTTPTGYNVYEADAGYGLGGDTRSGIVFPPGYESPHVSTSLLENRNGEILVIKLQGTGSEVDFWGVVDCNMDPSIPQYQPPMTDPPST